ncbi:hypothetical protein [Tomitella gaofuii]|uniref:hypothetical protein n=1 Tax=Tomitella gaofuii TaxID=2760083 RepID=UPI0015F9A81B|nr:hypothetical protein [Tomitella gaofuii]
MLGEAFSEQPLRDLLVRACRHGDSPARTRERQSVADAVLDATIERNADARCRGAVLQDASLSTDWPRLLVAPTSYAPGPSHWNCACRSGACSWTRRDA